MDKDVLARLAAIEKKLDEFVDAHKPVEYTINFSGPVHDERRQFDIDELKKRINTICTTPPIRGD